jgi:nucleotide-binding universal stress UspA family protein
MLRQPSDEDYYPLVAAVVRQAARDYVSQPAPSKLTTGTPAPGPFLRAAGLIDQAGAIVEGHAGRSGWRRGVLRAEYAGPSGRLS